MSGVIVVIGRAEIVELCVRLDRLLANPNARNQIKALLKGKNAYMQAYYATKAELKLAKLLDIPIMSSPDFNAKYSGKSGIQEILWEAGTPTPKARVWLESRRDFAEAVYDMWVKDGVTDFVVKMEQGASGLGNARYTLTSQLTSSFKSKSKNEIIEIINESLYKDMRPEFEEWKSQDFWDKEFIKTQNMGALQEFRPGATSAPSVQIFVDAFGKPIVLSTHEQVLDGGTFIGSKSPAESKYRSEIERQGLAVAGVMARKGFIGHAAIDYIFTNKGELIAIEINTRMSGTSHPQYTIRGLKNLPLTANTHKDFYRSTDNFYSEKLKSYNSVKELLNDPAIKPLLYDASTGEGILFHNTGSYVKGKIGFTAFAGSRSRVEYLYRQLELALQ